MVNTASIMNLLGVSRIDIATVVAVLFIPQIIAFSPRYAVTYTHSKGVLKYINMQTKKFGDVVEYKIGATPPGSVLPAPTGAKCLKLNPKLLPRGELPGRIKPQFLPNQHSIDIKYPGMRVVHVDPLVIVIERFLNDDQCDRLLKLHEVRDPAPSLTFGGAFTASERTSTTWHLYYSEVEELLGKASSLLRL